MGVAFFADLRALFFAELLGVAFFALLAGVAFLADLAGVRLGVAAAFLVGVFLTCLCECVGAEERRGRCVCGQRHSSSAAGVVRARARPRHDEFRVNLRQKLCKQTYK